MSFKYQVPDGYVACGGKIRIYPNQTQKTYFYQAFGCCRYVWNQFKACFDTRYQNNPKLKFPDKKLLSQMLTMLKQEKPWLKDVDSLALQQSLFNYNQAQWDFMSKKTINQGRPHFKGRKYYKQAYTTKLVKYKIKKTNEYKRNIEIIDNHHIKLPKVGIIACRNASSYTNYTILSVTVTWRQDCDKFQVSLNGIKPASKHLKKTGKVGGIDVGLNNEWLVTSDGDCFKIPDTKISDNKLKHYTSITDKRRHLANLKVKQFNAKNKLTQIDTYNFKNWQRSRKTKAKLNMHITNIRLQAIYDAVNFLVRKYDIIVIEDLKVSNLMHNHHLAKAIANACWYKFRQILQYKCDWLGKKLIVVPPQYTSRICSTCHKINPEFKHLKTNKWLSIRHWVCPYCHVNHDRDINAAINIMNRGLVLINKK